MRKYENTHACSGAHCAGAGGMAPYIPNINTKNNYTLMKLNLENKRRWENQNKRRKSYVNNILW